MKLTLLLIPIVFLASCTSNTEVSVTPNQEPTTIVDIHTATLNTYLKDVALYRATVRTMNPEKVIEDAQATYLIYSGTLSWTDCNGSEEGSDCIPPEFTAIIMGNDVAWFDEAVGPITCKNIDAIENTGVIDYIRETRCTTATGTGTISDDGKGVSIDFGSGFTLSQTDDETILAYSGKGIKTWSHTPPEKVPFTWDEGCQELFGRFSAHDREKPLDPANTKQSHWEDLGAEGQKACMKESLGKSIHTESTQNPRFYSIFQSGYEGYNQWVYDTLSGHIQDLTDGFYSIQSIEVKGNYITVTVEEGQSIGLQYVLVYDKDFTKKVAQWPENNKESVEITGIDVINANTIEVSARTIGESTQQNIKHTVKLP